MKFGVFSELYEGAKECENVDEFIERWENEIQLKKTPDDNIVLLLRFIYEVAHMSIKDIREYLGMPRPQFCEYYEIKQRTLEDWEYGKNPVPQRMIKLLSYTLVEDYLS